MMKRSLAAGLRALVLAPSLGSCMPAQRADQSDTLRQVSPVLRSAVDDIGAMFPAASIRTGDHPDQLGTCGRPKDDSHDGGWRSSEVGWIHLDDDKRQAQVLDDIKNHMTSQGWPPGNNRFTNGIDRFDD